jgi:nucleotide-binding universal stress UspA family protein
MSELAGTSGFPIERVIARHRHVADDYLDAVAGVLYDVTPTVSTASDVGDPSEAILRIIHERDIGMVIVASHGRGFLGRVVVGSVADRVARAADVPVLVIHPHRGSMPARADISAGIGRLVVPLDGSELAREALPVAQALALRLGIPVHLVRALPTREEIATHPDPVEAGYYEEMIAAAAEALESEAHRLRASGIDVTTDSLIGAPAATILDEIGAHDLIVMTSHGRGGVRRWLLGSVAERLIRAGEAPVLLVPVAQRATLVQPAADHATA